MSSRKQVLDRCRALPAAEPSYPFGEDTEVFKVSGKMFALVDLTGKHGRVTVKADPGHAAAMIARHPQISPGYHMNKRHWITIDLGDATASLPAGLVEDLLQDSYELVVAGLPARLRPLPPAPAPAPAPAGQVPPGATS